jgi:histidine triad (HIT) family protein
VYDDERIMAFLDINPIRPGHVQIIPKQHYAYFDDLPVEILTEISTLAQKLAGVLKQIYGVHRVGYAFTGGDVPHAHAHVVPLIAHDDITSRRYISEEVVTYRDPPAPDSVVLSEIAALIRQML